MKLRASEYINKAEGLKSSELSTKQRLESIRSQRASVQSRISTLESRLDSLYARMAAIRSIDSDNERSSDNSAAIASIVEEIAETQYEISENEKEDAELRSQESEANAELRQIEVEEQKTLSEIQDSAARENQNIALISAFSGDYSNVSAQAAGAFQHKLAQFAKAAQILGGAVSTGNGGAGGRASGRLARGNLGGESGSSRNFYEAANNQRKTGASLGAMGTKGASNSRENKNNPILFAGAAPTDDPPTKKAGGFGRKISDFDRLFAYMSAHNYGIDDYAVYSKDPKWQELHTKAYPNLHVALMDGDNNVSGWNKSTPYYSGVDRSIKNNTSIAPHCKDAIASYGNLDKATSVVRVLTNTDDNTARRLANSVIEFSKAGEGYSEMRSSQKNQNYSSDYFSHVKNCEEFIRRAPKFGNTSELFRGIHVSREVAKDFVTRIRRGGMINQLGLASWSTSESVAERFSQIGCNPDEVKVIFKIQGTKMGASIKGISKFAHENEVLVSGEQAIIPTSYKIRKDSETGMEYLTINAIEL